MRRESVGKLIRCVRSVNHVLELESVKRQIRDIKGKILNREITVYEQMTFLKWKKYGCEFCVCV